MLAVGTQQQRSAKAAHARQLLAAFQAICGRALPDTPLAHYTDLALQARHAADLGKHVFGLAATEGLVSLSL